MISTSRETAPSSPEDGLTSPSVDTLSGEPKRRRRAGWNYIVQTVDGATDFDRDHLLDALAAYKATPRKKQPRLSRMHEDGALYAAVMGWAVCRKAGQPIVVRRFLRGPTVIGWTRIEPHDRSNRPFSVAAVECKALFPGLAIMSTSVTKPDMKRRRGASTTARGWSPQDGAWHVPGAFQEVRSGNGSTSTIPMLSKADIELLTRHRVPPRHWSAAIRELRRVQPEPTDRHRISTILERYRGH